MTRIWTTGDGMGGKPRRIRGNLVGWRSLATRARPWHES